MMAAKARLFGDKEALAAILAADEPVVCKRIGRTVRLPCASTSAASSALRRSPLVDADLDWTRPREEGRRVEI
jgi:predicted NAD-dependent protein-ADP-ribosyltransferase YbiA (DUF1768 family)